TMSRILRSLRADHGVRSVLCEGGPTVLGGLIADGVLDELFLTVAPKLAGGGVDPAITTGPSLPEPDERRLIWLLEQRGTLFLRYA
ncbi:MAG TPA: dihydrofolate reductase family protein, partial [Solirubrobacteraceae bacterium]|nr:dihydrofolate reductase family protein [Solirubrobacteraceae bacterium]